MVVNRPIDLRGYAVVSMIIPPHVKNHILYHTLPYKITYVTEHTIMHLHHLKHITIHYQTYHTHHTHPYIITYITHHLIHLSSIMSHISSPMSSPMSPFRMKMGGNPQPPPWFTKGKPPVRCHKCTKCTIKTP